MINHHGLIDIGYNTSVNGSSFDQLYFFGRFNFPHVGYLYVIRESLIQLAPSNGLTVVLSAQHATWNKRALPMNHRIAMFRLAIQELPESLRPKIHLSRIEETFQSGAYTVDTLERLTQEAGGKSGIVMGADAAIGIPELYPGLTAWKEWEKIVSLATLIVIPRGRYDTSDAVWEHLPKEILRTNPIVLDTHPTERELHASSTRIQDGETVYLPDAVHSFATTHHLLVQ